MTHPDHTPAPPDGPTPAREQLPLPRRQSQTHIEPQLREPGGTGSGTPFAAFTADGAADPGGNAPSDRCADRAAAFHAGARRGRRTPAAAAPDSTTAITERLPAIRTRPRPRPR